MCVCVRVCSSVRVCVHMCDEDGGEGREADVVYG